MNKESMVVTEIPKESYGTMGIQLRSQSITACLERE